MNFRFGIAILLLAVCALPVHPARAGQSPLAEAQLEYNAGRYNRAVDMLTDEVSKSPDDARLHFLLGQCFYQLREFTRSVASFERSIELDNNRSEYHDWLGRADGRKAEETMFLGAIGWARKAHKEFETAVQLDPSNLEAHRNLIRYEIYAPVIISGGDEKATKDIEALEKIDPLQGQLARGEFLDAKKRTQEADAVFSNVLASNTDRIGVYFEVADYFLAHQNPAKMGEAVAAATRLDPDDRRLKYYRGILFVITGKNLAEAGTLLRSYLTTVPDNADLPSRSSAREWLGKLYEAQGKFSEAAQEYRLSLALDPNNKEVDEALKRVEKK